MTCRPPSLLSTRCCRELVATEWLGDRVPGDSTRLHRSSFLLFLSTGVVAVVTVAIFIVACFVVGMIVGAGIALAAVLVVEMRE